jgi:hypothetical protein
MAIIYIKLDTETRQIEILHDTPEEAFALTVDNVINIACSYFNMDREKLTQRSNNKLTPTGRGCVARIIIAALLSEELGYSNHEITTAIGYSSNPNSSNIVSYARRKIADKDPKYYSHYLKLKKLIG